MISRGLRSLMTVLASIFIFQLSLASEIMPIPSPPIPDGATNPTYSAEVLSGNGLVVAGHVEYDKGMEFDEPGEYTGLFRWTRENGHTMFFENTALPRMEYRATELNYDGTVVGFYHDWLNMGGYWYTSFRYSDEYGFEWLVPEDDWDYHVASDVSADGSMVVGWYGISMGPWEGVFVWKESGGSEVIPPPGDCTFDGWDGPAVSGDGQVIASSCRDNDLDIFSFYKWTASGGYRWLGYGAVVDISADGTVIVGTTPEGEAFRFTEAGGMEEIGTFLPVKTNGDGSVVIGNDQIWDRENGLQWARDYLIQKGIDLDSDGWIIDSVKDISDDGNVIIGTGSNDSTPQESPWMATITTPTPEWEAIVDNADTRFSAAGNWHVSNKALGFYGPDYAYAYGGDGSAAATFTFQIPADGNYRISAQWPAHSSRAPDAPFTLINDGTVIDTIRVNQQIDGGRFNPLTGPAAIGPGIYALRAGVLEVTLSNDAAGKVAADAVQVAGSGTADNQPPNGVIDTPAGSAIDIVVGDTVYFTGTGDDPESGDSNLTYLWRFGTDSGIADSTMEDPGDLQFNNEGIFTVTFTVTDAEGLTDPTPARITVRVDGNPIPDPVVVDNTDTGFSAAGNWHVSNKALGFYGPDYTYAYGGDGSAVATFTFQIPADGNYRISAQWPAHSSRAPDAPFTLINDGTVIDTIRVNQQIDGGRFTPLTGPAAIGPGIYALRAGVLEVTLSNDAAGKVAADAVQVAGSETTDN